MGHIRKLLTSIRGVWEDDWRANQAIRGLGTVAISVSSPARPSRTRITVKKKWKDVEQVTAYLVPDSTIANSTHTKLGGLANDAWEPKIYE